MKVLYVCYKNRDRSIAAEAITRKKAEGLDLAVGSAGLNVSSSYISEETMKALRFGGYNINNHHTKQLEESMIDEYDLILTMKNYQVDKLLKIDPEASGKVFTLPEYTGFSEEEIDDPSRSIVKPEGILKILSLNLYSTVTGYVSPADEQGVAGLYFNMIHDIEKYVSLTIERMKKENIL